jgi:hypothetical protein
LSGGGFSYKTQRDTRLIVWRIDGPQLELIEQSLVHKLNGNCKRIHFKNAMIIPRVFICELAAQFIIVCVATSSKLYRIVFPIQLITSLAIYQQNPKFKERTDQFMQELELDQRKLDQRAKEFKTLLKLETDNNALNLENQLIKDKLALITSQKLEVESKLDLSQKQVALCSAELLEKEKLNDRTQAENVRLTTELVRADSKNKSDQVLQVLLTDQIQLFRNRLKTIKSQSLILAARLQQENGKLTTDNMQLQSQFEENRSNQALVLENHVQRICKLEIENAQNLTFKRNFKFFLNENYPDLAANPNHASSGDGGGQPKRQKHDGSPKSENFRILQ